MMTYEAIGMNRMYRVKTPNKEMSCDFITYLFYNAY